MPRRRSSGLRSFPRIARAIAVVNPLANVGRIRIKIGCPAIARNRRSKTERFGKRAFAHVGHFPKTICLAPETEKLGMNYIVGLLLHEIGHLESRGDDLQADRWVFEKLGVPIQYCGKLHLEWVEVRR